MSEDQGSARPRVDSIDRLRRRIEQMGAIAGHPLQCSECLRRSSGRATGWTMHLGDDGCAFALCPECYTP